MATQLADVVGEADPSEPRGQPRAERRARLVLGPDCIAEDFANLFLRAATVSTSATLELGLSAAADHPGRGRGVRAEGGVTRSRPHDAVLVTRNARDFAGVPGLRVEAAGSRSA
jgi:hypothetical protein